MSLKDLLQCLSSVVTEWFQLGVQLNLPFSKLRAIERACNNGSDITKCKRLMLQEWATNPALKPSWCSLVDALHQLDENTVADDIAQKFSKCRH